MPRCHWVVLSLLAINGVRPAHADLFETIDGKSIARLLQGTEAKAVDRLTFADLGALPNVLKDARSTLLVARTSRGNFCRMLVSPGLRKGEAGGLNLPVFVVERFDTFDASDPGSRIARGRDVMLFPGYTLDLDTAQVVPEGQGGDLAFLPGEPARLATLPGVTLRAPTGLPSPEPGAPPRPTPGRAVVPADFAGRYRLLANGQWSGTLDLVVEAGGTVTGRFRSDVQGASYAVTGQVGPDPANKVALAVNFPRAHGDFEGFLWTEGKGALAGTFRLLDRTYGFFAVRDGGTFAPEGDGIAIEAIGSDPPGRCLVEVAAGEIRFEGKASTLEAIASALRVKVDAGGPAWVSLRARPETSYSAVRAAIATVEAAGVRTIRLAPIGTD